MMKKHLKPFTIALISLLLIAFPTPKMNSCGGGDYAGDNTWFFLPNLVNQDALIPFTYCRSWFFTPDSDMNFSDDAHLYKKLNPEHYAANVDEWAQVVPNVSKTDIHKALYEVNSDIFCSQLESTNFNNNSFIKALQKKQDLWDYFLLAKECEHYFTGSGWSNPQAKDHLAALPAKIEKILRGTKNPFIRQRAAYQLIKAYEYTEQQPKELPIFDEFFKNDAAAQKSWVYGHACYHYARANDSLMDIKKLYLARSFRLAPDKRFVTMLRTMSSDYYDDAETDVFKTDLKSREATDADRTTWTIMKALRYPGRSLTDIQRVYRAEPNNKELSLLIEREINKLEDWLFTDKPNMPYGFRLNFTTDGAQRSYKDKENDYQNGNNSDAKQQQKALANYQSDLAYLQEVAKVVEQIAQESKTADKTFMNLAAAHLAFLRKDVAKTHQYVAAVRQDAKAPTNVRAQANVIDILAGIYATTSFDTNLENSIMDLDKTIAKDTATLMESKTWMAQIYNLIGNKFVEAGRKAEGTLLLMKSAPAYLQLFDKGQPADFDAVLKIMENPQTPFEKFLSQTKTPYRNGEWDYDEVKQKVTYRQFGRQWDVHKIRDYKATYYLRQDQWDSAQLVLAKIPKSYWKQEPYKSMLYCNAFFIDLQHPHALVSADSTRFDKLAFVEKVIQLKNQFASNPSTYARNAYLIGNAYYNCSWYGNSWLMLDVAWSNGYGSSGMEGDNPTAFKNNFYLHTKALEWYEKAATNTTDASLKALSTFMLSWCENQAVEYWESTGKDKVPKPIVHNWLSQLSVPFSKTDYWCQQYEDLAHKCSGY